MPSVSTIYPKTFDLSGRWRVIHKVERSTLERFKGMEIEFDVTLDQENGRVTGEGAKFIVDMEMIRRDEASRIALSGHVDGEEVTLELSEEAPARDREIAGEIRWTVVTEDLLSGTFRVDAAGSAGTSRALRR